MLILNEPSGLHTGFRSTIEHIPGLRMIGHADLAASADHDRTVAFLFLRDGQHEAALEQVAALRDGRPNLCIVAVFRFLQASDITSLIQAGADAFVGQGTPASAICGIILTLANGSDLYPTPSGDAKEDLDRLGLTRREIEILRFLSAGFSNKEVARRLDLSVRTVEAHRFNLRRKTRTGRLKDLVALAREIGLPPVIDLAGAPRTAKRGCGRQERAVPSRYFFDLDDGRETIPDDEGVLAVSADHAIEGALAIITEMRAVGEIDAESCWNLVIRDAGGSFVKRLSIQ